MYVFLSNENLYIIYKLNRFFLQFFTRDERASEWVTMKSKRPEVHCIEFHAFKNTIIFIIIL